MHRTTYRHSDRKNKILSMPATAGMLILCIILFPHYAVPAAMQIYLYHYQLQSFNTPPKLSNIFYQALAMGICTVCFPHFAWFIPLYFLGQYILRNISARSVAAAIFGISLPLVCSLLFGNLYSVDLSQSILQLIPKPSFVVSSLTQLSLGHYLFILLFSLHIIILSVHISKTRTTESFRNRVYLFFHLCALYYSVGLTVIFFHNYDYFIQTALVSTFVFYNYIFLSSTGSLRFRWALMLFPISYLLLYLFNFSALWTYLSNTVQSVALLQPS